MSKIYTFLFSILLFSFTVQAQVEQVSVGENYAYQAYYNLSTGEVQQIKNDAWDLGFSAFDATDAGVLINESASFSESPLQLWVAETTNWNETISDMSLFTDENTLYNAEESWTEGAFNSIKDPNSPLDYGWGEYNTSDHFIEGNRIFVIQLREGNYIKIQIQKLENNEYTFRFASLDGSNETTATISKDDANGASLLYYSLGAKEVVEMPTAYDLVFQRYTDMIDAGDGNLVPYTVTGVLTGPNNKAVKADGIDPETVDYSDYLNDFSTTLSVIGQDWKFFDFSEGWLVDSDRAYFVANQENEVYKIVFYDFEGSSTGTTTLEKTLVGTITSTVAAENLEISVFPNPTSDFINVSNDVKISTVHIVDNNGRAILSKSIESTNGTINIQNLTSGIYFLLIESDKKVYSQPIIIQ